MRLHLEASQIILLFGNSDIFTSFFIIVFFIIFMIFIFADSFNVKGFTNKSNELSRYVVIAHSHFIRLKLFGGMYSKQLK